MRSSTILRAPALALALAVSGCGGIGSAAAPASPAVRPLAYGVPATPVVEYVVGDTARAEIQAAGQSLALNVNVRERWRMEFAPDPAGVRITATLSELDARMTTPLSAPRTADASAVSGPVVFTLDGRGRATVASLPQVSPAVAQFLSGTGIAHTFFPRLPARAIEPGDRWTDTVSYAAEEGQARIDVRSITTYAALGDSIVDGATHLIVRSEGTTEQSSTGSIGGTDFMQKVSGSTSGWFLWDRGAGAMGAAQLASDLQGAMNVTIAPVPLEVRVRSVVDVRRAQSPR